MNFRVALQAEITETEKRLSALRALAEAYQGEAATPGSAPLPWNRQKAPTPRNHRPDTKGARIRATAERMIRARHLRPVTSAEVLEELERAGLKLEARDKISYIGAILSQAGDITYRHPLGWTMQNLGVVA